MIWAPIAKLLTNWCTKEERGTWWALISTGQNTGIEKKK
jgi:sugar phosphate permease